MNKLIFLNIFLSFRSDKDIKTKSHDRIILDASCRHLSDLDKKKMKLKDFY